VAESPLEPTGSVAQKTFPEAKKNPAVAGGLGRVRR
jgi:hypothetical protein